jgi:hypothetical protein
MRLSWGTSIQLLVIHPEKKKGKSTISTSTSHGIISKYISLRSKKVKAHQKKISSYNVLLSLTTIHELQLPISKVII